MRKTTMGAVMCVIIACLLAGCNTMAGVGKDIKAGGQAVEDAAKK